MKPIACLKSATKAGRRASSFLLHFLLPGSCSDLWEAYTVLKTHEVITFRLDVPLSEMKDWSHGSRDYIVYNFLPPELHFVWPNQVQSSSWLTVSPSLVCSGCGGGDGKSFAVESVDPGCLPACSRWYFSLQLWTGFSLKAEKELRLRGCSLVFLRVKGQDCVSQGTKQSL